MLASPATAASPGDYAGSAEGDIVHLDASVLGGNLAGMVIANSQAKVASTQTPAVEASGRNAKASVVGFPILVDEIAATAPPSSDPPGRPLLPLPLAPVATVQAITADAAANFTDTDSCVAATDGERVLGTANTQLAGLTVLSLPPVGTLAQVAASETSSVTKLVDIPGSGSKMVSETTLTVGDISLLGGAVSVQVESPVVLTAESDGTTATTDYSDPLVTVTVGSQPAIEIEPNGTPVSIPVAIPGAAVDLKVAAFSPDETIDDASASATLDAIVSIDLGVELLILDTADVELSVGAMSATATAPEGGVDCEADTAPVVITSPADGSTVNDATPTFTGTAEPGETITLTYGADDTVIGEATADENGDWSYTPTTPLPPGEITVTATTPTSEDTVTFTIEEDATAPVVITSPTDGSTVNDATPTFTGTAEPGETITLTYGADDTVIGEATADENGDWSYTPTTPLPPGEITVTATTPTSEDTVTFTIVTDRDGDGLPDDREIELGTDPDNPDTDNDRLKDGEEVDLGTDPTNPDTDNDGLKDGMEVKGFKIAQKVTCKGTSTPIGKVRTDPLKKDSDGDGIGDGVESNGYTIGQKVRIKKKGKPAYYSIGTVRTNPTAEDTDRDGLTDKQERTGSANKRFKKQKTSPVNCDTDLGGVKDGKEVRQKSNPADVYSSPKRPKPPTSVRATATETLG